MSQVLSAKEQEKQKNLKKLASMLHCRDENDEVTDDIENYAKSINAVIVFGAGDDNTEFRGALYGEEGCFGGKTIKLEKCEDVIRDIENNKIKKEQVEGIEINAIWDSEEFECPWKYLINKQFEEFEIKSYYDDTTYCIGAVFYLNNDEDEQISTKSKIFLRAALNDLRPKLYKRIRKNIDLESEKTILRAQIESIQKEIQKAKNDFQIKYSQLSKDEQKEYGSNEAVREIRFKKENEHLYTAIEQNQLQLQEIQQKIFENTEWLRINRYEKDIFIALLNSLN